MKIDYEYIINLIQDIVSNVDEETNTAEFRKMVDEVRGYISEFSEGYEKLGGMMRRILDDVERDKTSFAGRNISEILSDMKRDAVRTVVDRFVAKWFVDRDAVLFAVQNSFGGVIPNAGVLKDSLRYAEYKESVEQAPPKFRARAQMIAELETAIQEEITPLQIGAHYEVKRNRKTTSISIKTE